jgi:hypothetical protein
VKSSGKLAASYPVATVFAQSFVGMFLPRNVKLPSLALVQKECVPSKGKKTLGSLFKIIVDIHQIQTILVFLMITITKEQFKMLVNNADVIHINRNLVKKVDKHIYTGDIVGFLWEHEDGDEYFQPVTSELFEYFQSTGQVRWTENGNPVVASLYVISPLSIEIKS